MAYCPPFCFFFTLQKKTTKQEKKIKIKIKSLKLTIKDFVKNKGQNKIDTS